jgi:hypothetical protein
MASLVVTSTRRLQKPACVAILVVTLTACGASGNNSANGRSGASTLPPRTRAPAIRLVPASAVVRRSCLRAARRFTVTIYCPMRVPAHWVTDLICIDCNGTFSITGGFTAPRNYLGMVRGSGHFTVWAATPALIRQGYVGCTDGRPSGRARLAGLQMRWIDCPQGSGLDGGHILLQWSHGGWRYALSMHSDTSTNRQLLRMIARHLARFR